MLRSLMTFSGFTLMSRILGFVRDILIARFLGAGVVADAFFTAFRFPNMFRRIFGEGAFNSAFVPLFGKEVTTNGRNAAMQFANNAFSVLALVLSVLTVIAVLAMGPLMVAVVPGFLAKFDETLTETPQDFTISLKGARAIHFDGGGAALTELQLVERGKPEVIKVLQEAVGGEVQAVGQTVSLLEILDGAIEDRLEAIKDELPEERQQRVAEKRASIYQGGQWTFNESGFLEIPLPKNHDFALAKGKAGGSGELKIFRNDPGAFDLTVKLSKITFVYLMCMALVAHLSGVLTTLKKFMAPAFTPVLLNIIFIIGLVGVVRWTGAPGEALSWCVAIAGFVQLGFLWWVCLRAGLPVGLKNPVLDHNTKRLLILMGPGVIAAGIQQINLLIGGIIASFQQGAISYLYYSDRVYQLPLGMIGIAFGMVLLPEITRLISSNQEEEASNTMVSGIELAMIVTVPAAIALMVIPGEIISVLFEGGDFQAEDAEQTGRALAAFAIGLPGYVLIKVLQPGYFAREDTKSPMKMAGVTVLVNILVSLLLFPFFRHVGIAFATSVAAWVNVALLWFGLRGFVTLKSENKRRLMGMLIASVAMAVVLCLAKPFLAAWLSGVLWQKVISMSLLIGVGGSTYALGVLLLKVTSPAELKSAFKR